MFTSLRCEDEMSSCMLTQGLIREKCLINVNVLLSPSLFQNGGGDPEVHKSLIIFTLEVERQNSLRDTMRRKFLYRVTWC